MCRTSISMFMDGWAQLTCTTTSNSACLGTVQFAYLPEPHRQLAAVCSSYQKDGLADAA